MDERLKLYSAKQVSDLFQAGNRVFGVSKTYPTAIRDIPNVDKLRGDTGEQIISGLLNLNSIDNEELFVCHSIGTHDDSQGETDHVVIYKNKIIVVETKTYNGYNKISISKDGIATGMRGDIEFKIPDNKMANKIKTYQKRFPNRRVEGLLSVARYGISTTTNSDNYDVASLQDFQTKLERILSTARPIKEDAWPAVKFFASLCIRSL